MQALLAGDTEKARVDVALGPAALAADFGRLAPLNTDVRSIVKICFDG